MHEPASESTVREKDIPEDPIWEMTDNYRTVASGSASLDAFSTPNTFGKPSVQSGGGRGVSKRKLAFGEEAASKASLQLVVVFLPI